jgi:biotin carboxyl carrier protein
MKLDFELEGQTHTGEFQANGRSAQFRLGDRLYEVDLLEAEPSLYTIILNHQVFNCSIERAPAGGTEIIVNGKRIPIAVRDKKRMRGTAGAAGGADGRAVLISPMPGKVVRLLRQTGDEVDLHQGVMVVEAMKMQNEVQSPKAGRVSEIKVQEGQTVNAGEILAVIE